VTLAQEREEARKREIPGWVNDTSGRPQLPEESFGEFFDGKAERNRDRVYLYFEDQAVSYLELRDRTNRIANGLLDMGVTPGEKVAIMMYNRPEYVYSQFALNAIGAVFVPINVALKGEGLAYIINQSDSETLILEQQLWGSIEPVKQALQHIKRTIVLPSAEGSNGLPAGCISLEDLYRSSSKTPHMRVQPGDMLRILYTSGTTGLPKGTVLRRPGPDDPPVPPRDEEELKYAQTPEDIPYTVLPLFHALGQADISITLNLEGAMTLARRFSARRFWPDVRRFGCTRFTFAGSIAHILLKQPPHPDDRDHPMRIGHGYAPLGNIKDEFEIRFNMLLIENYGSSDYIRGRFLCLPGGPKGSIGRPGPNGPRVKVVDEQGNECPPRVTGEIISRPHDEQFAAEVEYYQMPEASQEKTRDGWFHTGDYGYRDADGWIFFSDRERQFIRRGGENISSLEIERVIDRHPDVVESAAMGVRAEFGEQDVKVSVVLRPGRKLKPEELIAYCEDQMGYYMVPRYVDFRDSLPKTGTERVQKYKLVDEGITDKMWDREQAGYKLKRERK